MQLKKTCLAMVAALALAACGGGDDDRPYESLVSFGDSLSDVGSYRTPGILAASDGKGGKYTVNGAADGVWVEQLAARLGLPAPCAALTGLESIGAFAALAAPVTPHAECTAYGQGGSRVVDPVGPWNKALLNSTVPEVRFTGQLGQLTVPVATQIANHLAAHGGSFTGKELITVLAGANDVFFNIDRVADGTQLPTAAGPNVATAGAQLAGLIKAELLARGAKRVVVLNLPNISNTPASLGAEAQAPGSKQLVDQLTLAFNAQLAAGLAGTEANVLQVDLYTENTAHVTDPARFGLTDVATPACTNTFPNAPEGFLAPSLTCTTATTRTGSSRYLFADTVHPTPYGHSLLRDMTVQALKARNWL